MKSAVTNDAWPFLRLFFFKWNFLWNVFFENSMNVHTHENREKCMFSLMHWFYIKCGLGPHIYFWFHCDTWFLILSLSFSLYFPIIYLFIYVFIFWGKAKASAESRPLWQDEDISFIAFCAWGRRSPPQRPRWRWGRRTAAPDLLNCSLQIWKCTKISKIAPEHFTFPFISSQLNPEEDRHFITLSGQINTTIFQ